MTDAVALALDLVRFDTISPPGSEDACAGFLANLVGAAGLEVASYEFAPRRTSLIARLPGTNADLAPLVFTGHLDTVPLGSRPWSFDPHGEIRDGRLYGRGASDMKGGVAAFIAAALDHAHQSTRLSRGVTLVITAGEETGCLGAADLARRGVLGPASALVVAEPTANRVALAHKGALHLRARTTGRAAHGSMPEAGDNAVLKATRAVELLRDFTFDVPPHPLLGTPSIAVTGLHGGEAVNVIPDSCTLTLDVRTIPGQDHRAVLAAVSERAGPEVKFEPLVDLPAVGTSAEDAFAAMAVRAVPDGAGIRDHAPIGMPYFTDASVLQEAFGGCPTVILGPGEPSQAHQTDEWCSAEAILKCKRIFESLIADWCVGG